MSLCHTTTANNKFLWYDVFALIGHVLLKSCTLFLVLSQALNASPHKPFIDSINFPTPDGTIVDQLFTDQQQMLWMTSWGGYLNRYDGMGNTSQLRLNVEKLNLDDWGRLWYVEFTDQAQYARYINFNDGQRVPIRFLGPTGQPLAYKDKLAIVFKNQEIWLLTLDGNLYHAKLSSNLHGTLTFTLESHLILHPQVLFHNVANITPFSLTFDALDNLWFGLGDQLARYSPKDNKWTDFSHLIGKHLSIDNGVFAAITQEHGTWLILTSYNSLYHIDQQDHVTKFDFADRFLDIKADPSRNLIWISGTNGLHFIIGEETTIRQYNPEPWQDAGLPSSTIRLLHVDSTGNLWFNSPKGVHVVRTLHNHVQRIIPNIFRQKQEPDARLQVVLGLVKENAHILWWYNRHQELVRYDSETGKEQVYPIPFDSSVAFDTVRSIAFSGSQILLTGHFAIIRFDTKTRRFLSQIKAPLGNTGNTNNFLDNVPNAYQQLWLSGFEVHDANTSKNQPAQRIFNYWDTKTQTPKSFVCDTNTADSTYQSTANALNFVFQYDQTVWVAANTSIGTGMLQLSLATKQCQLIALPFKPDIIYNAMQTKADTLWLVQGHYIRQIRLSDHKVLFDQAMPLKTIEAVRVDHQGHILVYGDAALWRFDTADTTWHPLFAAEIALENKSGVKHYFDEVSHTFYILSHQGILAIDTQRNLNLGNPKLMFTSYSLGDHKTILFPKHSPISLPYGEPIEISYVTMPLVPSKLIRYRYRLNPDQPWTETTSSKLLLTQLPPRQTTLEFQATYSNQDFGDSEFLPLTILPPWWHSYWAYASYLISALLVFFGLSHWLRTRDRLRQANLTVSVFENTSEGLCVLSPQLEIVRINRALQQMMGWQVGDNMQSLLQQIILNGSDNKSVKLENFPFHIPTPWKSEYQLLCHNSIPTFAAITLDSLANNSVNGRYILVIEDISERKQHEKNLDFLARHDHLTQLPNRLYFDEHIMQLIKCINDPYHDRHAFILMDLDDFKTVNDSMGHKAGDQLLIDIAQDMSITLQFTPYPEQSLVARHSGDEFVFIVKVSIHQETLLINWLHLVMASVLKKRHLQGYDIEISASLGITFFPDNSSDPTVLLQQADMAMYMAKKEGKGRYAYYNITLEEDLKNQIEIENALTSDINDCGLRLYYQPKVSFGSAKIIGFEALARWQLASGKLLPPLKFLPLIRPGKIEKLFCLAVFQQAARDCISLLNINPAIKISINMSPKYLDDPFYIEEICQIFTDQKVPPHTFVIELLEDAGIDNLAILENLDIFRAHNIGISIDDFGTGYSNMAHLSKIGANELKIDRSLIKNVPGDATAEKLFFNILEMARCFNMTVVCEGVETKEQFEFIKATDCHCFQGFYFSQPVPLNQAVTVLKDNSFIT